MILKPKKIAIHSFQVTQIKENEVYFKISCSKGTYIRSIAHDFGKLLNSGGHLSALRREAIGEYDLKNALNVEEWIQTIKNANIPSFE